MIKLKENQLIAMLNIVKKNPEIDIWELMNASGVSVLREKTLDLSDSFLEQSIKSHNVKGNLSRTISKKVPPKGQRYSPGQKEFYK